MELAVKTLGEVLKKVRGSLSKEDATNVANFVKQPGKRSANDSKMMIVSVTEPGEILKQLMTANPEMATIAAKRFLKKERLSQIRKSETISQVRAIRSSGDSEIKGAKEKRKAEIRKRKTVPDGDDDKGANKKPKVTPDRRRQRSNGNSDGPDKKRRTAGSDESKQPEDEPSPPGSMSKTSDSSASTGTSSSRRSQSSGDAEPVVPGSDTVDIPDQAAKEGRKRQAKAKSSRTSSQRSSKRAAAAAAKKQAEEAAAKKAEEEAAKTLENFKKRVTGYIALLGKKFKKNVQIETLKSFKNLVYFMAYKNQAEYLTGPNSVSLKELLEREMRKVKKTQLEMKINASKVSPRSSRIRNNLLTIAGVTLSEENTKMMINILNTTPAEILQHSLAGGTDKVSTEDEYYKKLENIVSLFKKPNPDDIAKIKKNYEEIKDMIERIKKLMFVNNSVKVVVKERVKMYGIETGTTPTSVEYINFVESIKNVHSLNDEKIINLRRDSELFKLIFDDMLVDVVNPARLYAKINTIKHTKHTEELKKKYESWYRTLPKAAKKKVNPYLKNLFPDASYVQITYNRPEKDSQFVSIDCGGVKKNGDNPPKFTTNKTDYFGFNGIILNEDELKQAYSNHFKRIIENSVLGYSTIFTTYGNSGAGKSFTIQQMLVLFSQHIAESMSKNIEDPNVMSKISKIGIGAVQIYPVQTSYKGKTFSPGIYKLTARSEGYTDNVLGYTPDNQIKFDSNLGDTQLNRDAISTLLKKVKDKCQVPKTEFGKIHPYDEIPDSNNYTKIDSNKAIEAETSKTIRAEDNKSAEGLMNDIKNHLDALSRDLIKRSVDMNKDSSRSHTAFYFDLVFHQKYTDENISTRRVTFLDLAGLEPPSLYTVQAQTSTRGNRETAASKEGGKIVKSLESLGGVVKQYSKTGIMNVDSLEPVYFKNFARFAMDIPQIDFATKKALNKNTRFLVSPGRTKVITFLCMEQFIHPKDYKPFYFRKKRHNDNPVPEWNSTIGDCFMASVFHFKCQGNKKALELFAYPASSSDEASKKYKVMRKRNEIAGFERIKISSKVEKGSGTPQADDTELTEEDLKEFQSAQSRSSDTKKKT